MKKMLTVALAAVCAVPALAFAADPAKNSSFQYCPKKNQCPFGFNTTKNGRYIKDIKLYAKCSPVPVENWGRIRVKNGKFSKSGTVTDVTGQKIEYTIKGRFAKPRKAVGTYEADRKDCSDKARDFVAKRVGRAQSGF